MNKFFASDIIGKTKMTNNLFKGLLLDCDQKMDFFDQKILFVVKLLITRGSFFDLYLEDDNARYLGNVEVKLQYHIRIRTANLCSS